MLTFFKIGTGADRLTGVLLRLEDPQTDLRPVQPAAAGGLGQAEGRSRQTHGKGGLKEEREHTHLFLLEIKTFRLNGSYFAQFSLPTKKKRDFLHFPLYDQDVWELPLKRAATIAHKSRIIMVTMCPFFSSPNCTYSTSYDHSKKFLKMKKRISSSEENANI